MVWSWFSYHGKGPIVELKGRVDANKYIDVLKRELFPWAVNVHGEKWQFQKENAPIHTARHVRRIFCHQKVEVLDWSARSPDLKPIKNLWAILARCVYENSWHFSDMAEMKDAINVAWEDIENSVLQKLTESMPRSLKATIRAHGDITKYWWSYSSCLTCCEPLINKVLQCGYIVARGYEYKFIVVFLMINSIGPIWVCKDLPCIAEAASVPI